MKKMYLQNKTDMKYCYLEFCLYEVLYIRTYYLADKVLDEGESPKEKGCVLQTTSTN